ncbi:MAG: peptidase domain-containing ABC transporter, partial [Ktedonobacteraceae bacterium]|nr:peptidase domain-containing ABC transporter [Ktedonobacteraceae bacterium]
LHSNTDVRNVVSSQLISTLLDGCFMIFYLIILLAQSLTFSIPVLIIAGIQSMLLFCTARQLSFYTMRSLDATAKSQSYETEVISSITTLKAAGAEQRAMARWMNLFRNQLNTSVRLLYLGEIIETLVMALNTIAPLLLLILGTMGVMRGEMSVGKMLALNTLAISCLLPLSTFVRSCQQIQMIQAHLARISDVLETEKEQDTSKVLSPPMLLGEILLRGVSFRYDPQSEQVLHDINVFIRPGQRVAIVGHTGSGKSTLGKLLLGLYLPTEGEIFYDGFPLSTLDYRAVRAQFGVVMQDAHIFSGSIRQNIAFNYPDMEVERIMQAAKVAGLHDDIEGFPMSYETFVAEEGNTLSGGQRQRLAIARAVAHNPSILLLDEATSSLDAITEQVIVHNLASLSCTQIIIAHRLSTVRHADVILVMHEGCLVEQGSHQQLLKQNGYYADLIRSQAFGEVVAMEGGTWEAGPPQGRALHFG